MTEALVGSVTYKKKPIWPFVRSPKLSRSRTLKMVHRDRRAEGIRESGYPSSTRLPAPNHVSPTHRARLVRARFFFRARPFRRSPSLRSPRHPPRSCPQLIRSGPSLLDAWGRVGVGKRASKLDRAIDSSGSAVRPLQHAYLAWGGQRICPCKRGKMNRIQPRPAYLAVSTGWTNWARREVGQQRSSWRKITRQRETANMFGRPFSKFQLRRSMKSESTLESSGVKGRRLGRTPSRTSSHLHLFLCFRRQVFRSTGPFFHPTRSRSNGGVSVRHHRGFARTTWGDLPTALRGTDAPGPCP